jgi:hypothetical protein
MAVDHSILVSASHLLTDGCDYADLGDDSFVRRDADRARQPAVAQLQALGYQVILRPPSTPDGDSPFRRFPGDISARLDLRAAACRDAQVDDSPEPGAAVTASSAPGGHLP